MMSGPGSSLLLEPGALSTRFPRPERCLFQESVPPGKRSANLFSPTSVDARCCLFKRRMTGLIPELD